MAHDKNAITISRFDGSLSWSTVITPADRRWILYLDVAGVPYLYLRAEDTTDAAGDTRERYVYDSGASGLTRALDCAAPAGPVVHTIRVYEVILDSGAHQWVAATPEGHATGADSRAALTALPLIPGALDPALGEGVAILAL